MNISTLFRSLLLAPLGGLVLTAAGIAQTSNVGGSEYHGMLWQFGANVSGSASVPSASFTELPGVTNCLGANSDARFSGGSGGGFAVSALAGMMPTIGEGFASHIGYQLRLGYASSKTSFETEETIGQSMDRNGNIYSDVDLYTIDATVTTVRLEPMVLYHVGPSFPLLLRVGASLGMLMSAEYSQKESIKSPGNARYIDGSRERNVSSGTIEDKSGIAAGVSLGLGYDVALTPSVSLRPEVTGLLGLSSPISGVSWSPHEIQFGLSVVYTLSPSGPTPLDPTGGAR